MREVIGESTVGDPAIPAHAASTAVSGLGTYDGPVFTYVVTSYTNPQQTVRLLRRLRADSPDSRLVVSHDRKAPAPDPALLAEADAELWLTPQEITWGDSTYLRSELAAVARAQLAPTDWLTVLTGQDYPVRPLVEYEAHLQDSGADMLLEAPESDDPNIAAFLERYRSRAYRMPRWVDRHRIHQIVKHVPGVTLSREPRGLPPYLIRRRMRTPFRNGFVLYKGCDLFALSGRAADRLLTAPPRLLRYYSRTRIPSESYVHTVLRNQSDLVNLPGMLHYARWAASPHPEWLTIEDLPAMLASGRWFARKFREDDPVLDRLDDRLDRTSFRK